MKTLLSVKILLLVSWLSACSWVNENPNGQSVAISKNVVNCPVVGTISVNTVNKVTFIKRRSQKVLTELQVLARNEALKINANTISPLSDPVDGAQQYTAYRCPR